jgi:hypothetical protein
MILNQLSLKLPKLELQEETEMAQRSQSKLLEDCGQSFPALLTPAPPLRLTQGGHPG